MSDTTTQTADSATTTAPVSTLPPITYSVVPFRKGGAAEQFSFTTKEYNSIDAAVADLGAQLLLDVLNAEVAARIGMKARSSTGFGDLGDSTSPSYTNKKNELVAKLTASFPSKVIFTEADAKAWKPGERELTINGIQKKVTEAYKLMAAAKTPEEKANHFATMQNWLNEIVKTSQRDAQRAEVVG